MSISLSAMSKQENEPKTIEVLPIPVINKTPDTKNFLNMLSM